MSRWIDAEYAKAYPIRIDHYDKEHGSRHFVLGIESVMEYLDYAPSIDIVRCKECKYWNTSGCREGVGECEWAYYMTEPNDFCSYGEREGE